MMTSEQLSAALDRYGGDRAGWPPDLRAAAEALIAADPDAARMAAAATRLDRSLAALAEPAPFTSADVGRVVAGLALRRPSEPALRPGRRLAAWSAAALVACLAVGFALGLAVPSQGDDAALAALIFGGAPGEPLVNLL